MRTQAVLRPPVLDLPPPFDALILRVALVRAPQQIRVVARVVGAIRIVVRKVKARWATLTILIPRSRVLDVFRARGPPD